jgi:hypothetical protein
VACDIVAVTSKDYDKGNGATQTRQRFPLGKNYKRGGVNEKSVMILVGTGLHKGEMIIDCGLKRDIVETF